MNQDSSRKDEEINHFEELFGKWSLKRENERVKLLASLPILPIVANSTSSPDQQELDPKDKKCNTTGNFIRLKTDNNISIYEYDVTFNPHIENGRLKHKIIRQFEDVLGKTPTFDGRKSLFLPFKLTDKKITLNGRNPYVDCFKNVTLEMVFRRAVRFDERKEFYNILFFQFFDILGLKQTNEKFYDQTNNFHLPKHRLLIRPGIMSFVRKTDEGLMVGLNLAHMTQRKNTFNDILDDMRDDPNYKEKFSEYAIGKVAVTSYNNICYPVDDICWEMSPNSTSKFGSRGVTYAEYYLYEYGIKIKDNTQPLLITRARPYNKFTFEETPGSTKLLALIPELCFPSGLNDARRGKGKILADLGEYTLHSPAHRINSLRQFMAILKRNPDCITLFQRWGLEIEDDFVKMDGRIMSGPTLQFNPSLTLRNAPVDFTDIALSNTCYKPVPIKKWQVYCIPRDTESTSRMVATYKYVAQIFGIKMTSHGQIIQVHIKDRALRSEDFLTAIRTNVKFGIVQFIIVVLPECRDEVYTAIKTLCFMELGIASQMILASKIRDEERIQDILRRVVPQVNCKLGGSLWALKVPTEEALMFVGMDAFHDPNKHKRSVHAIVASLNSECTRYYSRATVQTQFQEIGFCLKPAFMRALEEYRKECSRLPDRIIVFRDGVSSGNFDCMKEYEVESMLEAIRSFSGKPPKFCFMVIQKRIWERVFSIKDSIIQNPVAGTVVDNTITKPNMTDFFLVSQFLHHGTIRPTHCVILEDGGEKNVELYQKLAHISAFMYYNWPGSLRIPGICQYAHKLASFIGNHLKAEPKIGMEDKLYYI